ncbi:MAG: type II toxin-antitoxin system VapC family toxin [Actinomycetota bacterium]|nr:type II toxin-antitoxin system VapC family toxin [Actinomycetota bacterium]
MNLLLDTHVLLWWLSDDPKLRPEIRETVGNPGNVVLVSAASAWEISIQKALGKLDAPDDLEEVVEAAHLQPLPITLGHAMRAGALPKHHDDPFDRMLVAQAQLERLLLTTADRRLAAYEVAVLLA